MTQLPAAEPTFPRVRAMTLVEVLAVVVILALLATVLTVSVQGHLASSRRNLAKIGIGQIVQAIEAYSLETGRLPPANAGLDVLTAPANGRAPLLRSDQLLDPWGHSYIYLRPGQRGTGYSVMSYGSDGQLGGAADSDAEDISSDALGDEVGGS